MIYLLLFWEFFKTGLFSIGGGLATIPFLMDIASRHPEWYTVEELTNMIAVSESTPGPIGINMATYAGFSSAGILGALVATISLVLPSLIVILLIAGILNKFKQNRLVKDTFYALRPAVLGMLAVSTLRVAVPRLFHLGAGDIFSFFNPAAVAIFVVITALVFSFKKIHPIVFIAAGAVAGIIFKL